jgi:hypothetical protein
MKVCEWYEANPRDTIGHVAVIMIAHARATDEVVESRYSGIPLMATKDTDPASIVEQFEAWCYRRDSLRQLNVIRATLSELHRLMVEDPSRGR